jgi:hypothetical protein
MDSGTSSLYLYVALVGDGKFPTSPWLQKNLDRIKKNQEPEFGDNPANVALHSWEFIHVGTHRYLYTRGRQ